MHHSDDRDRSTGDRALSQEYTHAIHAFLQEPISGPERLVWKLIPHSVEHPLQHPNRSRRCDGFPDLQADPVKLYACQIVIGLHRLAGKPEIRKARD